MLFRVCLTAIFVNLVFAPLLAAEETPYSARVTGEDVYVRSGPGVNYYPTDKLQPGDMVEVYRQDPGGWCAIRPPKNAFSWVEADKLKPLGDGLAAATEGQLVVRVGSSLSDLRDVIQVRLERNERVEIFAAPEREGAAAWVKIAPPAGEFRWISTRFLERDGRAHTARRAAGDGEKLTLSPRAGGAERYTDSRSADESADSGRWSQRNQYSDQRRSSASNESRALDAMNAELSGRVVQDISQWEFSDLKRRAENSFSQSTSSADRAHAQELLNKIARFDDIKLRRENFNRQSGVAIVRQAPTAGTPIADARYDGSGRLAPLSGSKLGGPQYALMDDSGSVVQFVAAAPGVNLQPYVNKQIGVTGPRSYSTDLQKQVINAQRVTVLGTSTMLR
jgi:hypothetical protein